MLFDTTIHLSCCHCGGEAYCDARMRLDHCGDVTFVGGLDVCCMKVGFRLYEGVHEGHDGFYTLCDSCWDEYNAMTDAHFNEEHDFLTRWPNKA